MESLAWRALQFHLARIHAVFVRMHVDCNSGGFQCWVALPTGGRHRLYWQGAIVKFGSPGINCSVQKERRRIMTRVKMEEL